MATKCRKQGTPSPYVYPIRLKYFSSLSMLGQAHQTHQYWCGSLAAKAFKAGSEKALKTSAKFRTRRDSR